MSTERTLKWPPVAILLTGVGYIGAALLRRLAVEAPDEPIVAIENYFCTPRADVERALPRRATLIEGDVADAATVQRAFDIAVQATPAREVTVFHLAAQPSAGIAARDPDVTERSNLTGARVVLSAARTAHAQVVFGGSFRVYGDDLAGQTVTEATPYGTVGDLSHLSKIYVEHLARMLGVRCVSVRLGVTYGVSPIMKTDPAFMTVPNVFCQRAAHGDALQVHEDRAVAFVHVDDAARALIAAARLGERRDAFQAVNAAPEVMRIADLARLVERLAAARGLATTVTEPAPSSRRDPNYAVVSRLGSDFPARTLDSHLGAVLDLFIERGRAVA